MQHSFMYQAGKQWNNLPGELRASESLSIFKKNLQNLHVHHRTTAIVCFVNSQIDYLLSLDVIVCSI